MYPKLIWKHRNITTIVNPTLDYISGQIHDPAALPNPGYMYLLNGTVRLISLVCFLFAMLQQAFIPLKKHV